MEKLNPLQNVEKLPDNQSVNLPISLGLVSNENRFSLADSTFTRLKTEAQKRIDLSNQINDIFTKIGDSSLDTLVENGTLQGSEADHFYSSLSDFLQEDPNHTRLILYLPFQIFPDLNKNITPAKQKLAQTLRDGFIKLLHISDIRASFNDGDILEPGMGDPPRTRKIGHLLPQFLEKNILSVGDIVKLMEISHDSEISKSIFEGVVVANDQKLFNNQDWENLLKLAEQKGVADILGGDVIIENSLSDSLEDVLKELEASLEVVNLVYSKESEYVKKMSSKRAAWEKGVRVNGIVEEMAHKIAKNIENGNISIQDLEKLGIAGIRGLVRYTEMLATNKPNAARSLLKKTELFNKYLVNGTPEEHKEVETGCKHLQKLGVLPDRFLTEFKIKTVDLSQSLPIDVNDFAKNEGKIFVDYAKTIESDPKLSKYFYPLFLVFGSRIKGYADQNGDFDFAIFIKPNISLDQRDEARSILFEKMPALSKVDKILEYWTETKNDSFGLKSISRDNFPTIVGFDQIHFLLGGVWLGKSEEIQKLQNDLVSMYLNLENLGGQKDSARSKLLAQLELDILQYRLMHKGFRKNYPSIKGQAPIHGHLIDWESDFWDPGYRKIATQLFLKKVFLPDLA